MIEALVSTIGADQALKSGKNGCGCIKLDAKRMK
jgi:hypothetical protein